MQAAGSEAAQVAILLGFYSKFDKSKALADVVAILAKRKGEASILPDAAFDATCGKLAKKYGQAPAAVFEPPAAAAPTGGFAAMVAKKNAAANDSSTWRCNQPRAAMAFSSTPLSALTTSVADPAE